MHATYSIDSDIFDVLARVCVCECKGPIDFWECSDVRYNVAACVFASLSPFTALSLCLQVFVALEF